MRRLSLLSFLLVCCATSAASPRPAPATPSEATTVEPVEMDPCPPAEFQFGEDDVVSGLQQMGRQIEGQSVEREFRVLAWMMERDERPLTVQSVVVWVHEQVDETERWVLMSMYRNPETDHDRPFSVNFSFHEGQPHGFFEFDTAPSVEGTMLFLESRAQWSFQPGTGFRRLGAGVCADAWQQALGGEPPEEFAPHGPDFISDEERMSLAAHQAAGLPVRFVEGRVLNENGSPVAAARVIGTSPSFGDTCCYLRDRVETTIDGGFRIGLDPRIEYALEVSASSGVSVTRHLGESPPSELEVQLPSSNVPLTIEVRCTEERPNAGRLRVYRGAALELANRVYDGGAYFGTEGPPYVARTELLTSPEPHRVIVTSACGITELTIQPPADGTTVTIAQPDVAHPSTEVFLLDGDGAHADGGFRLMHPDYGTIEGYSETQPVTLRGFPPGDYVIERWGVERSFRIPSRRVELRFPEPP